MASLFQKPNKPERWVAYYDTKMPAEAFKDYDLVIFDRVYHPDFRSLRKKTIVLAYVSMGEVPDNSQDKHLLEADHALFLTKNRWGNWPVTLASARWREIVLSHVDDAISNGFDGVMLDTVDSALHASASVSPALAMSNRDAAVALINQIRDRHPNVKIMLNRGFDILPNVADKIDYALAESILTEINLSTGQSSLNPSNSYQQAANLLLWARDLSPKIKIYTLDYWSLDDLDGVKAIYTTQRAQGFAPYVSTPDLRQFTPEPG